MASWRVSHRPIRGLTACFVYTGVTGQPTAVSYSTAARAACNDEHCAGLMGGCPCHGGNTTRADAGASPEHQRVAHRQLRCSCRGPALLRLPLLTTILQ